MGYIHTMKGSTMNYFIASSKPSLKGTLINVIMFPDNGEQGNIAYATVVPTDDSDLVKPGTRLIEAVFTPWHDAQGNAVADVELPPQEEGDSPLTIKHVNIADVSRVEKPAANASKNASILRAKMA